MKAVAFTGSNGLPGTSLGAPYSGDNTLPAYKPTVPKLEIWRSSENQEEHHYFMVGQAQGHEPNSYLFGVNPRFFSPDQVKRILDMLEERP